MGFSTSLRKPAPRDYARRRWIAVLLLVALMLTVVGVGALRYAMFRFESRAMLSEAHELLSQGEHAQAAALLQRYIPRRPSNTQALYDLARAKVGGAPPTREHVLDAVGALQTLLAAQPGHRDGQHLLLQCLERLGDRAGASALARKLVAVSPQDPAVLRILFQNDTPDEALARAQAVRHDLLPLPTRRVVVDAMIRAHLARGDSAEALAYAEDAMRQDFDSAPAFNRYLDIAASQLTRADLRRKNEHHTERQTNDIDRDLMEALGLTAILRDETGATQTGRVATPNDRQHLMGLLESLAARDNLSAEQSLTIAEALLQTQRNRAALALLEYGVSQHPHDSNIRERWWRSLTIYGDAATLTRFSETNRLVDIPSGRLGALALASHHAQATEAVDRFVEALNARTTDAVASAWMDLIRESTSSVPTQISLDHVSRVLALSPDEAAVWLMAGKLHEARGDLPRAAIAYHRANQYEPSWREAANRWHRLARRTGSPSVVALAADHRRGLYGMAGEVEPDVSDEAYESSHVRTLNGEMRELRDRLLNAPDLEMLEEASRDAAALADELGPYMPMTLRRPLVRALLVGGRLDLAYHYGLDQAATSSPRPAENEVSQINALRHAMAAAPGHENALRITGVIADTSNQSAEFPVMWRAYRGENSNALRPVLNSMLAAGRSAEAERLLRFMLAFEPNAPANLRLLLAQIAASRGDAVLAGLWLDDLRQAVDPDAMAGWSPATLRFAAEQYLKANRAEPFAETLQQLMVSGDVGQYEVLRLASSTINAPAQLAQTVTTVSRNRAPHLHAEHAIHLAVLCDRASAGIDDRDAVHAKHDRLTAARAGQMLMMRLAAEQPAADVQGKALALAAKLSHRLGELAEAETLYRRALAYRPTSPSLRNNLALVLAERGGEVTEARKLAEAVRHEIGEHPAVLDTLALIEAQDRSHDSRNTEPATVQP